MKILGRMMLLNEFLLKIKHSAAEVEFDETIQVIAKNYIYTPVPFVNGDVQNKAGENEGSCKIFAFARANNLTSEQTLFCFGKYYREEVLNQPDAENHANIRSFIKHGWNGIDFKGIALLEKS